MPALMRLAASVVVVLALIAASAEGQPERDARHTDPYIFNLGPLGGTVKLIDRPGKSARTGLQVQGLTDEGPGAAAGLETGDIIIGAPKYFGPDAYLELGAIIADLETKPAGKPADLSLKVLRDGKELDALVSVAAHGSAAKRFPEGPVGDAAIAQSLEFLAARQADDGSWPDFQNDVGNIVLTSICGMAFLAAGHSPHTGRYKTNVDNAARYVMNHIEGVKVVAPPGSTANWDQSNWSLGFGGMFLSEIFRVAPSEGLTERLEWIRDRIEANMTPKGGFGHGPGGPSSNGYIELQVVSNYCLAALGGIRAAGIKTDDRKLKAMKAFVEACVVADGGVGYALKPADGVWESCVGRTAGAYMAWVALGHDKEAPAKKFTEFVGSKLGQVLDVHVSPTMHYLTLGCAAFKMGKKHWAEYWRLYRSHYTMARSPDGSFMGRPTEETPRLGTCPDHNYGPVWCTAYWTVVMCIPKENLPVMFGSRSKPKNPAKGE